MFFPIKFHKKITANKLAINNFSRIFNFLKLTTTS